MAALEHRVITGILRGKDMADCMSAGLVAKEFKDAESRQIYQFIYRWWHNAVTYKSVPTVAAVRKKWPSFDPTAWEPDEDGSLKSLVHELKMRSFETDIRGLAEYFSDLVEEDPEEAIGPLKRRLDDLAYRMDGGSCMNALGIVEHTLQHYKDAQDGHIYGIPWPWDPLTQDTLGKLPGQFVVFYGRMKSMKTWLILYCAAIDFLLYNQRVLIWSRQMDERSIALRLASIMCKVDYQLLKKGRLPPKLRLRTIDFLKKLEADRVARVDEIDPSDPKNSADLIVLAGQGSPKTIDELRGALHTYQPNVLYADSFYHLRSEREGASQRWQQVAAVAEDLKAMAQDFDLPIIGTTQANRSGEKNQGKDLTEVADADNIAREADLIVRVIKRKGRPLYEKEYDTESAKEEPPKTLKSKSGMKHANKRMRLRVSKKHEKAKRSKNIPPKDNTPRIGAELALILGGNRDGVLEAFTIHAIPGYNFKIIDACFSSDKVKVWLDEDNKKMANEERGEKAKQLNPATFEGTQSKSTALENKQNKMKKGA